MTIVTGLFRDKESAERAFQFVTGLGYEPSDINVIMSDATRDRHFSSTATSDLEEQAITANDGSAIDQLGTPMGGTIGTLAPIVAAVGVLLIPGIAIVAGPVTIALAAAGAVGLAGGLVGILGHWGIPEARLTEYAAGVAAGGILLGVHARTAAEAHQIQEQWQHDGGEHIHS